jgi:hypothetical protein
MKAVRTGIAVLAIVLLAGLAYAQAPTGTGSGSNATHGQRAASKDQQEFNRMMQAVTERLKLTDDQTTKVRSIMQAEALKIREIRTKFKGTPDTPEAQAELKKELDALRADTHTQLAGVLSPAQMGELQKMHDEAAQKMKEKAAQTEKAAQGGDQH